MTFTYILFVRAHGGRVDIGVSNNNAVLAMFVGLPR
jgi:hypothetical protein